MTKDQGFGRRRISHDISMPARNEGGASVFRSIALYGIALLIPFAAASPAGAQVVCPPQYVSGTVPLPQCLELIRDTAPAVQAAIFGSQSIAVQTNSLINDRLSALRSEQGQASAPPAAYADSMAYAKAPRKGADPITPHIVPPLTTNVRPGFWVRGLGDFERREGTGGIVIPGTGLLNFDEFYRQRTAGIFGGADLVISGLTSGADGLILGVSAGYVDSTINLNAGRRHTISGGSIGAYGTYFNGGFFLDALFKVDLLGFNTTVPTLPVRADVTNYSVAANIGYKFDMAGGWYIEPTVGIEHVWTDFSNQALLPGNLTLLENARMLRGRAGARVGTSWVTNNIRIEPSVLLVAYHYFEATGATVNLGAAGGTIALPTDQGKTRGELQGAVNLFDLSTGVSGFVRGDLRFGDDYIGGGARAGIRIQR